MKPKTVKQLTDKQLTKKLDDITRKIVQARDLDWREMGVCISCQRVFTKDRLQVGHYISRRHHSVRWNCKNVALQCISCNGFRGGNLDEYALSLQRKYGKEILEELHKEKQKEITRKEKIKLLEDYQNKLKGNL